MKLAAKRRFDQVVGEPALFLLNRLALLLGHLLRRDHRREPVDRVLVLKFQGMGSLILAKPALAELRRRHPGARVTFWGTPSTAVLARELPEFDEVIVLDDRNVLRAGFSALACLARLWRRRPDWAFDLEVYSRLSSILMTLTCARNRVGFAVDTVRNRQWTHTHLVFFNRYRYLGDAYAKLIGLCLPDDAVIDTLAYGDYRFPLDPPADPTPPYLVFNIHAGELSLERKWPREYFAALVRALLDARPDATGVLIGHGARETEETAAFPAHPRLRNLAGKLDLPGTVRLLAGAELVVSNDTAPLHFALSSGVPVVGLFGPTRASTYFPVHRPRAVALTEDFFCSPCIHHWEPLPCGGDNQCMKTLPVARVLEACAGLLGIPTPAVPGDVPDLRRDDYYAGLVSNRFIPRD